MPSIKRRDITMYNDKTKFVSMAEMLVYYERLRTDNNGKYKDIYNAAKNSFNSVTKEVGEIIESGEVIRKMGENEAKKEQAILDKIFGKKVSMDLNDPASVKEFISTLNACLNLKSVYERNVELIKQSKGSKSVISFFPTYFLSVWNDEWENTSSLLNKINLDNNRRDILEEIRKIIKPKIEEMIPKAIEKMLTAEPELSEMPKEMENAYKDLLGAIGTVQQTGSLSHQISEIYNLDKIAETLTDSLMARDDKRQRKEKVAKTAKTNFHQKGGFTLEAIENTVFNLIASTINIDKQVHVYYTEKKETGFKADNIITFGIDAQLIQDALETNEATSRERNKKMFEELGKKLKDVKDGYIVYSSDKNYTYNEGFKKRGGFSAESISLDTYRKIMKFTTRNARTFVGTILQTAKGAIGDPSLKEDLEEAMAQDVAYFLFDDFKSIGNEIKRGHTQSIHIMNLDGILIPLSFFLLLLARAIEEEVGNPEDFVKVDIYVPQILFFTQEEQSAWLERNGASSFDAWIFQREEALAKSKIEVHFLKEFQQIIRQFL